MPDLLVFFQLVIADNFIQPILNALFEFLARNGHLAVQGHQSYGDGFGGLFEYFNSNASVYHNES